MAALAPAILQMIQGSVLQLFERVDRPSKTWVERKRERERSTETERETEIYREREIKIDIGALIILLTIQARSTD